MKTILLLILVTFAITFNIVEAADPAWYKDIELPRETDSVSDWGPKGSIFEFPYEIKEGEKLTFAPHPKWLYITPNIVRVYKVTFEENVARLEKLVDVPLNNKRGDILELKVPTGKYIVIGYKVANEQDVPTWSSRSWPKKPLQEKIEKESKLKPEAI